MKKIILLILTLILFNETNACINGETLSLKDGTLLYEDEDDGVPFGHSYYFENFKAVVKRLDSLYKTTKDLDYLSDKGVVLILSKQYNQAVELYLEIEKIQPNRYSTASNIGTAYELLGQNENALKWIKKSIIIDPKSHKNSEWIHIKILEAKIKGQEFVTSNFLLNTDFGSDTIPKTTLSKSELEKLYTALYYQLNERVSFVKPKEKIVAQLYFDLGNTAFLLNDFVSAITNYNQAEVYGFERNPIKERIKNAKRLYDKIPEPTIKPNSQKENYSSYIIWGFLGLVFLFIGVFIVSIFKRKKNNS